MYDARHVEGRGLSAQEEYLEEERYVLVSVSDIRVEYTAVGVLSFLAGVAATLVVTTLINL